jgi:HK97 family phage major capsid protein
MSKSAPKVPGAPKYDWPSAETEQSNIDRRYLRFPELGNAGGDGTDLEKLFARGQSNYSPRDVLMADWIRAVTLAPPGMAHHFAQNEIVKRALSEGTDAAGGYLVPSGFVADVTMDAAKLSQLYQFTRKLPVNQNAGTVPKVSSNVSVNWGSENTTIGAQEPAFGEVAYTINRMDALATLSRELVEDASPDVVQVVAQLFQEAIAAERDKVIAIGSGTGKPQGIYSASGITNVSITSLTYANMVTLKESLDQRYHGDPSLRWVCNQAVKAAIMKVVDSTGRPIFVNDATTNWEPRVLGVPLSIEPNCPNNFLFIGALRYYYWFTRSQMVLEKSTEAGDAFSKHQVILKITERCDGRVVLPPTSPMVRTRVLAGIS